MAGILRNPFPLDSYAHPCYSSSRRGTGPATHKSLPPRWGKVRACPILDTGIGVKMRILAPRPTCLISVTLCNFHAQFRLASVSSRRGRLGPPAT